MAAGLAERLVQSKNIQIPGSWSPDGKVLAYTEIDPRDRGDIWTIDVSKPVAARKPRSFLKTRKDEIQPKISPDGRWIAYTSKESGRWEVYVTAFPDPGGKWQVSEYGGIEPIWSSDGSELFYRERDRIMSVSVSSARIFDPSKPKVVFTGRYRSEPTTPIPSFDVGRDGKRFVVTKSDRTTRSNQPPNYPGLAE